MCADVRGGRFCCRKLAIAARRCDSRTMETHASLAMCSLVSCCTPYCPSVRLSLSSFASKNRRCLPRAAASLRSSECLTSLTLWMMMSSCCRIWFSPVPTQARQGCGAGVVWTVVGGSGNAHGVHAYPSSRPRAFQVCQGRAYPLARCNSLPVTGSPLFPQGACH